MTLSIRYKEVTNTTGAPLTPAGISPSDGDDKQYRITTRILTAADIGANPGQSQDPEGCLIDVLRSGHFHEVKCATYRDGRLLDNVSDAGSTHRAYIIYGFDDEATDGDGNTYTRIEFSDQGTDDDVRLEAGDIIVATIFIGGNHTVR
jgi:hypothetical protein